MKQVNTIILVNDIYGLLSTISIVSVWYHVYAIYVCGHPWPTHTYVAKTSGNNLNQKMSLIAHINIII